MYEQRIKTLEDTFILIEKRIANKEGDLPSLIDQKATIQSELSRYRRLQWEEDHESVHFDDDH